MGKRDEVPDGPITAEEALEAQAKLLVQANARALLVGLKAAGMQPYEIALALCCALVYVADAQPNKPNKRAALALSIDFLQARCAELFPTKPGDVS